jgi:hypothetical protein
MLDRQSCCMSMRIVRVCLVSAALSGFLNLLGLFAYLTIPSSSSIWIFLRSFFRPGEAVFRMIFHGGHDLVAVLLIVVFNWCAYWGLFCLAWVSAKIPFTAPRSTTTFDYATHQGSFQSRQPAMADSGARSSTIVLAVRDELYGRFLRGPLAVTVKRESDGLSRVFKLYSPTTGTPDRWRGEQTEAVPLSRQCSSFHRLVFR